MKDEKERMYEYFKDHTNAHGDLLRDSGVDKIVKKMNVSLSTIIVIVTIILILMFIAICFAIYPKIYLVFSMNKKDFIKTIEKTYGQKIEIVQDNSSEKGNGTIIFRTKKEPKVEFNAMKNVQDSYKLDYEEKAFIYYIENSNDEVFKNITYEKQAKTFEKYPGFEIIECTGYLTIENYSEIEEASNRIYELQKWMTKKIKKFTVPIKLKIGDYISNVDYRYASSLEDAIFSEKYNYYWYLKNNNKDISIIPKEDILKVAKPERLEVFVNGEKLIDVERTENNQQNSYEKVYANAIYNLTEDKYYMPSKTLILGCDKFTILDKNTNMDFSFLYKGKTYKMEYRKGNVKGNTLPYDCTLEYFEEAFGAKIEYNYEQKRVDISL